MKFRSLAFILLLFTTTSVWGDSQQPPPPEKYDVQFRYRIRTNRDERIRQFREMEATLKKLDFVPEKRANADLDIFDPDAEILRGTIGSKEAFELIKVDNIKTLLLLPVGTKLTDEPKKTVQVRLHISAGLSPKLQKIFHDQVASHLTLLGFQEAVAYDNKGFSIVRGTVPAGNLPSLLKDLRSVPSGWFLPLIPRDQIPSPLGGILPIRIIEVLPEWQDVKSLIVPNNLGKLSPELQAILSDPVKAEQPIVVEGLLEQAVGDATRDLRGLLRSAAIGASIEGFVGNVATVRLPKASMLAKFVEYQDLRSVRLPIAGTETARNTPAETKAPPPSVFIEKSNLGVLHAIGYRGQGVRAVVIASEFDGLEVVKAAELPRYPGFVKVKTKQLPQAWLFDFTGETDPLMMPRAKIAERPGYGTATAIALHAAAPETDLLLIRVDPLAMHQVMSIAKAVIGTAGYTNALQSRIEEVTIEQELLASRRRSVADEYRKAIGDLSDDEIPRKRRVDAFAAVKLLQENEATFKYKVDRFKALIDGVESLKGSSVVVNTLVWEAGFPQDGISELSQLIERSYSSSAAKSAIKPDKNPPPPVWIQPASIAVGQVWAGSYLDPDENGVMSFADDKAKIPAKNWTRELNFLAYEPIDAPRKVMLPAGTRVRISMQWREPHHRDVLLYQEPGFPMRLRLLRQLDPEAKMYASDDFVEVARSAGITARLLKTPGSGVYEVSLETTLPSDGVYALRVEGANAFQNVLPAVRQGIEIRPRIAMQITDAVQAGQGRIVFDSFAPEKGGVAIPGDSPEAVTIGTGTKDKPTSQTGAGPGVELRVKPELFTTGMIEVDGKVISGTAVASGYAGGVAACFASAGVRKTQVTKSIGLAPGDELVLPVEWLKRLPAPKPKE